VFGIVNVFGYNEPVFDGQGEYTNVQGVSKGDAFALLSENPKFYPRATWPSHWTIYMDKAFWHVKKLPHGPFELLFLLAL
jgi:hypothetical protein